MNEKQNWVVIAAISDLNYCLNPKTTKKEIVQQLRKTRDMLRDINNPNVKMPGSRF